MKTIAFILSLSVVGACGERSERTPREGSAGSGSTPAESTRSTDTLAKATAFRDRVCACNDKYCAANVNAEYFVWGTDMATKRPDKAIAAELAAVTSAYDKCLAKLKQGPSS